MPQLRTHKRHAHTEKQWSCNFCHLRFAYRYQVKAHVRDRHSDRYNEIDFSEVKPGCASGRKKGTYPKPLELKSNSSQWKSTK